MNTKNLICNIFLLFLSHSFRRGDSLAFNCIYDTSNEQDQIHYGVSHGDEMCAPILLYYPHAKGASSGNMELVSEASYSERLVNRHTHRRYQPHKNEDNIAPNSWWKTMSKHQKEGGNKNRFTGRRKNFKPNYYRKDSRNKLNY